MGQALGRVVRFTLFLAGTLAVGWAVSGQGRVYGSLLVGLGVGLWSVVSLVLRLRRATASDAATAVRLMQYGSFLRLMMILAVFWLANRTWPDFNVLAGLIGLFTPPVFFFALVTRHPDWLDGPF